MKKPTLGTAGRKLWQEISKDSDIEGAEPLLTELCVVADRLAEIRTILKRDGLVTAKGRKHPLCDMEARLSGHYATLWKLLGLADDPNEPKRPPGRPTELERQERHK